MLSSAPLRIMKDPPQIAAAERSMSRQTQAGREASRAAASGFAASPRATTLSSVVPTA